MTRKRYPKRAPKRSSVLPIKSSALDALKSPRTVRETHRQISHCGTKRTWVWCPKTCILKVRLKYYSVTSEPDVTPEKTLVKGRGGFYLGLPEMQTEAQSLADFTPHMVPHRNLIHRLESPSTVDHLVPPILQPFQHDRQTEIPTSVPVSD